LKNLLGRLMSRPFEELKTIANAWGTLTRDPNPTQNDLAIAVFHTMVERSAMRGVWENLDPEARQFVEWLLHQRNMLALVDDLPANLACPQEEVVMLLERARRVGLVDVDEVLVRGTRVVSSGDNLYAWATKNQTEAVKRRVVSIASEAARVLVGIIEENKRPAPFEEPLSSLLENLEQEDIQRIASAWKLPDAHRYYKAELIGVMTEFLATSQGRHTLLSTLSQSSQNVFSYLESAGGNATAAQVRKHFGWDEREFRAAVVPLVQRVLVWDALTGDRRYLFIPHDLLKGNTSGAPSEIAHRMQPKLDAPAPHTVESRLPYEMAWDMLTLASSAARQELSLTLQEGRITKRVAKKLNDELLHPTDIKAGTDYIDVLVHLAHALGILVEREGEQPAYAATPKADDWAKLSFDAHRRRIFGFWQDDRKWVEPAAYGTIYWWNSDLTGARKRLVKHIAALPVGQWISLEGFLRKVHLNEPFIIWSQEELVRRFGLRALQGFRSQWFEIEGRIITDMLKTMLYWLGAVDLGRDKPKRLISFRLTPEGAALLDPEGAEHATTTQRTTHGAPEKTLMVQPNFEVLVLHPDSHVVWNLLRVADLVRHDRVSVYTLNKESVLRAIEHGMSPGEIQQFLQANTGKELPQNVFHSIADWARLVRRLDVLRATLIEVDEPTLLDELMASRKTRRYITRRLSPTTAIATLPAASDSARSDPWHRLIKELRGAGYIPRYVEEVMSTDEPEGKLAASHDQPTSLPAKRATGRTPSATGRRRAATEHSKTGTQ
jgi:hypothetical protein